LKGIGKESLRQISSILGVEAPGEAEVFVDGLPVTVDEVAEGLPPCFRAAIANPLDCRVTGDRKAAAAHVTPFHYWSPL